jgi:16S rRNA (uracil1498-N3)-methyltransferase
MLVGAPANERMDWLVEKAAELGVASIWPVLTERSVMRLSGERAGKKAAHWQSVAQSACEQCGRNRVPVIHPMQNLREVLSSVSTDADNAPVLRRVLSLRSRGNPWEAVNHAKPGTQIWVLNGPEGGLTEAEEALAVGQGFVPAGLGPRVLRAETAALVALTRCVQYES